MTRQHLTIFVDGGYFVAGAGHTQSSTAFRPTREDIIVNVEATIILLRHIAARQYGFHAEDVSVRWYDAYREDRPLSVEHKSLEARDDVELVLGPLRKRHGRWEQKRVDALIQRDLTMRAAAGDDIVLVAGDEDLTVGVECARALGAAVHSWGVYTPGEFSCSPHLIAACNDHVMLTSKELDPMVSLRSHDGVKKVASAMGAMVASSV